MTAYVLTRYTDDSHYIEGIFSTSEIAKKHKAVLEVKDYKHWKQWLTCDGLGPTHEEIFALTDTFVIKEYEVDKEIERS
jgi:hypothetical protein